MAWGRVVAVTGTGVLGGRYVLREVLGTGGMATVWRARDEVLGRDVAVKVLSPQYAADPGFPARFDREARHAAGLSHPRLVTVFDCGVDGTTPFIVMELVTGRTLRQVLDETGMLAAREAVRIAAAVCEALEVAHAAGLVHRDIKPANIVQVHDDPGSPSARRPGLPARLNQITARLLAEDPAEAVLAAALAASLAALAAVLVTGAGSRPQAPPSPALPAATHPARAPTAHQKPAAKPTPAGQTSTLPPAAAAAAAFVGDLQGAVTDGQVTQQAGQDLFSHLQQLLFGPPGQNAQQIQQLAQAYDQHLSQGQITGPAATRLRGTAGPRRRSGCSLAR
jgi:serine/threonine-protein kinase